jgi:hypothetical protein
MSQVRLYDFDNQNIRSVLHAVKSFGQARKEKGRIETRPSNGIAMVSVLRASFQASDNKLSNRLCPPFNAVRPTIIINQLRSIRIDMRAKQHLVIIRKRCTLNFNSFLSHVFFARTCKRPRCS